MCDSVNLIMSVEKYPCIWDTSNADYHDRDVKEFAWEQICREVIDDWESCKNKENKGVELKKKWTHIRDYHRKKLLGTKNYSSGHAAKKSKTYVYSQLLSFLTPVLTKRDSEGNIIKDGADCSQQQSDTEEDNNEQEEIVYMESPVTSPAVGQKRKKYIPTQFLDVSTNNDEDDDVKFLLSFRSYMKRMNHHQKLDFKMGMLQLVKNVNIRKDTSSSQGPLDNGPDEMPTP